MRARRPVTVVSVLAALALGHVISDRLSFDAEDRPPVLRQAWVGSTADLGYAEVEVTDVRTARNLAPRLSGELARRAGGVFVLVSATLTATREPVDFLTVELVDRDGRAYRTSAKSTCDPTVQGDTGLPLYTLFCFDVPTSVLEGLRFRTARGSPTFDATRGDAMSDVDLGIDAAEADAWAATEDSYGVESASLTPFELQQVELTDVES